MALQTKSISANGSKGHHKFTLTVTENSTSTNNTSSISWAFKISPISGGYNWVYENSVPVSYTVTINGIKYTGNIMSYDGSSTVTVKSGNNTITHDTNGKKTISYSFSVTSLNVSYLPGSASANGTMELTTIARQATLLTAPNFSDGDNPTITYSNPAGNAVSGLKACISIDGNAATVPYRDISKTETSYTFNLTDAERNALRNATTGSNSRTVIFFIRTTIDGKDYHSALSRTFSINNANPIVSGSVIDTNPAAIYLTGNPSKLVKYISDVKATMTATPQKGASMDESQYFIKHGNSSYQIEKENGVFQKTFNAVESSVFTFSAKDNRGNVGSATVTKDKDMVDYVKLTCNISQNRPDGAGDMTVSCTGNYFNGSFGAVTNTLKVQYRYKLYGGSYIVDWTDMDVTLSGNSYYAEKNLEGLDYQATYTFETRAIDKVCEYYETAVTSTGSPVSSKPIFHWGKDDFVFEVPVTFNAGANGISAEASGISEEGDQTIDGDLNVTGNLRLKGSGNYGNILRFGDGDYCYLKEATDDALTIKATRINLEANGVYVDGYAIPILDKGTWTPSLSSSAISSYTTQYGWYMKMNQTVTAGFFIKATCRSGYDSTNISISGLPYTPMFSASGGGMCSGASVSAGFNFQCYVAETSGSITIRVQACNNTSKTNLSTSASGCYYRSSGGEITLSGTITYMSNS